MGGVAFASKPADVDGDGLDEVAFLSINSWDPHALGPNFLSVFAGMPEPPYSSPAGLFNLERADLDFTAEPSVGPMTFFLAPFYQPDRLDLLFTMPVIEGSPGALYLFPYDAPNE